MPRTDSRKNKPPAPPPPPPAGPAASVVPVTGSPSMAPRGQFNRRQEGQRFLASLKSIAPNPRNPREEWEYETEEFAEFVENVENTELIQDPAVSSVDAFLARYPDCVGQFGSDVEWVLLAGERRYRAVLAKAETAEDKIPVVLRDKLLDQGDFVLLSENNYRKGWDPIQEATILERIRREAGLTYDEILERLGGKFSSIKRRGDISKRIKLLELEDGPLRRAIRQRQIGLEPAYTLVSRLKDPALIEQGWALMQAQDITAKIACDTLLGEVSAPASAGAESADLSPIPAGGAPQPVLPPHSAAPAGFVDETPAPAVKVPAQGSTPDAAHTAKPTAAGQQSPSKWSHAAEVAARIAACGKVLASRTWPTPNEHAHTVAVHAVLEASGPAFEIAVQLADGSELPNGDRLRYLTELDAGGGTVLKMAYAVALATDELRLQTTQGDLDARAAAYLKRLHDGAGFDIAGYRPAQTTVSSTKP